MISTIGYAADLAVQYQTVFHLQGYNQWTSAKILIWEAEHSKYLFDKWPEELNDDQIVLKYSVELID